MMFFENIPLASKTSYRIGGPARFYCEPTSESEVYNALRYSSENKLPVFFLGKGSNVLVSDNGWPGLVINLSALTFISRTGLTVEASGGYPLDGLVSFAVENGCGGAEELSGIPGTVGGAVVMNAGAFSTCIADVIRSVRVLNCQTMEIETKSREMLDLGYRSSSLKGKEYVVLSATFEFKAVDPVLLEEIRKKILCRRQEKQPLEFPNCGSVFKRPAGNYAGTLIEMSGLKGFGIGNVEVSTKHANFLINKGNAKAEDVRKLISHIRQTVFERYGILLEPEVIFVGDFKQTLYEPEL